MNTEASDVSMWPTLAPRRGDIIGAASKLDSSKEYELLLSLTAVEARNDCFHLFDIFWNDQNAILSKKKKYFGKVWMKNHPTPRCCFPYKCSFLLWKLTNHWSHALQYNSSLSSSYTKRKIKFSCTYISSKDMWHVLRYGCLRVKKNRNRLSDVFRSRISC